MNEPDSLKLVLFETDLHSIAIAMKAGITDFIVDWEYKGKKNRQFGHDTEINKHTLADLSAIASLHQARSWCRLNAPGFVTRDEIDMAIGAGASAVLLPMVTSTKEVEEFLRLVNGRCQAGILLETPQACQVAPEIAQYPLDIVYVGLNDLMIGLKTSSIFSALKTGIIDKVRACFDVPLFGFGGVTVLDHGQPLPCKLFMQEMSRLNCNLTFLRRSYKRDIDGKDATHEINRVHHYWQELARRSPDEISRDHQSFLDAVKQIELEKKITYGNRIALAQ